MITLLTAALVVVTSIYAFFTFRILKANEKVVSEMRKQSKSTYRPYINIRSYTVPGKPILFLGIFNIGRSPAYNLRLEIDKDFYQFGEKESNLREFNAFQQPIECFPPGAELKFYLAQNFVLFGKNARPEVTPLIFTVKATYSFDEEEVTEATTIDLRQYLSATIDTDPVASELKKLGGEIVKSIEKTIRKP